MTDAPKRIWAASSDDAGGAWVPWQIDAPEYTRADLQAMMENLK